MLTVSRATLPNGLLVLTLRLPHVHSACLGLMVRTGPRYESSLDNGISHLVEHLVLRGTASHPSSRAFHVAVEALGGEINGMTQRDATTIYLSVPPRHARAGLRLLSEACIEPTMDGLEIEKDVVIEEILDTYDGQGRDLDPDGLSRRILWPHPIGLPVAGEVEIVERLSAEMCRAHFDRTFTAQNAVLVLVGPLDPVEMLAEAAGTFGRMPRGTRLPEAGTPIPVHQPPIHIQPSDDAQVTLLLSYPAPHENDPRFPALLLLKRVLDDGFGSRLRQDLIEQRGLAYSLLGGVDAYADTACFDVEVTVSEDKLVTALTETLRTLAGLQDLSEEELDRAKTRHVAELEFALDDPSELLGWYGGSALMGRTAGYEDWLQDVMSVRPADVIQLGQDIFARHRALLTLIGPVDDDQVSDLERLMARPEGTTVWISELEEEEEEEEEEIEAIDAIVAA